VIILRRFGAPLVGIVGFLVVWEAFVRVFDVRKFVLLAPSKILSELFNAPGFYWDNTLITAGHMLLGLAISVVVSILVGAVLSSSRFAEEAAQPVLILVLVTPWVAYFASVKQWLGLGMSPIIFLAAFTAFPVLTFGVIGGMKSADPAARELLASVDARPWEVFWFLRLPAALPSIFTTARFALGISLAATYYSETRMNRTTGLGAIGSRVEFRPLTAAEVLWTTVFCTASLGILGLVAISAAERVLLKWHASQR